MGFGMGLGRGMGRAAQMFKSESSQILTGVLGICAAGGMVDFMWMGWISDRKPKTMTPAWKAATLKYRAAQNQDPITNQ